MDGYEFLDDRSIYVQFSNLILKTKFYAIFWSINVSQIPPQIRLFFLDKRKRKIW